MLSIRSVECLTTAMVGWDEIWQGYPDHWVKVHGLMMVASLHAPTKEFKDVISKEASKFLDFFANKKKYRPPFEKMVCEILNFCAGKTIIPLESALNGQLCYDCATKHLSEAMTSWHDSSTNAFFWTSVIGNLSHASNHLVEKHPTLSNMIRGERKKFMNEMLEGRLYRPPFEMMVDTIKKMAEKSLYMELDTEIDPIWK